MAAPWDQTLYPASLRGVPVDVSDRDLGGSRNTVTHTWVQSEDVFTEDMGRKEDTWSVTGYLWGLDVDRRRAALLDAVRTPGAAEWSDPWDGTRMVNVTSWRMIERRKRERWIEVSLSLVESGTRPAASVSDSRAETIAAAEAAQDPVAEEFSRRWDATSPAYVNDEAALQLTDITAALEGLASRITTLGAPVYALLRDVQAFRGALLGLIASPGLLARSLQSLLRAVVALSATGRSRYDAAWQIYSIPGDGQDLPAVTPSQRRRRDNTQALAALIRRTAVIEAARATATLDWPVRDDAISTRGTVTAALTQEIRTASDPVKLPLRQLAAAVTRDITRRGSGLVSLTSVTPDGTLPALVLAHRHLGSARRADEILTRNPQLRDPLLVPGGRPLWIAPAPQET